MTFSITSFVRTYCLCAFLLFAALVAQGKEKIETPNKRTEGARSRSIPTLHIPWVSPHHPLLSKPSLPLSLDPIRFTLQATQPTVAVGEEVEITITAQLLDIPASAFFIFEEQKSFSIKLLLPQGFTQTGGDYQEYIGAQLTTQNNTFTKRIRGVFTSLPENLCFALLRGAYHANASSVFEQKQILCLSKKNTPKATRVAVADCTAPVLTPITAQTICYGGGFYMVSTSVTNGVEVYYQWYNDNGAANNNTNPIAGEERANLRSFPTAPGVYKYRIVATSSAGSSCSASESVTLTVYAPPTITSTTGTNPSCAPTYGGTISVIGAGGTALMYSKDDGGNWVDLTGINAQDEITRNAMLYTTENDVARVKITLAEGFGLGPGGEYKGEIRNGTITPVFDGLAAGTYKIRVKNENGCISEPASVTLTNPNAPAIFNVTGGGTCVAGGAPINLSGSSTGVNYSLLRNGVTITAGVAGTGSALSFGNQTTEGTYTVMATNATTNCSAMMTNTAVISSGTPPAAPINSGGDKLFCASNATVLEVSVAGGQTADWYSTSTGGTPLSGGTGAISFTPSAVGVYYVETRDITTQCKSTTRTPVTLLAAPTLSITGDSQIECGNTTLLKAQLSSSLPTNLPIKYEWRNGLSGPLLATTDTLRVATTGTYVLTLTYSSCTLTASKVITDLSIAQSQDGPISVCATDNNIKLSSKIKGNNISFQWYKTYFGASTPITGATDSTYTIPNLTESDFTYNYYCTYTKSGCPPKNSDVMSLVGFVKQPLSTTVPTPSSYAEFKVEARGNVISHQWQRNNITIPGADNNLYGFNPLPSDQGAQYSCVISSRTCSVSSDQAALSMRSTASACNEFKINAPIIPIDQPTHLLLTTSGCIATNGQTGGTLTWKYTENGIQKTSNEPIIEISSGRVHTFVAECAYANITCSDVFELTNLCLDYWFSVIDTQSPYTVSPDGSTALLKVGGSCDRIEWSNGQIGNSITVSLDNAVTYLASCIRNEKKCGTVSFPIKTLDCNTFNITTNTPLINALQLVKISANSCTGKVIWKEGTVELPQKGNDLYVTPSQTTQYSATCIAGNTACTKTFTISVAPNTCIDFSLSASLTTINTSENTLLKAIGCPGIITWDNNAGTGSQVLVNPTVTTTYTANCQIGDQACPPQTITIQVKPASTFTAWANQYEVSGYEKANIYTSGCGGAAWGDGYYITWETLSATGFISSTVPKNYEAQVGIYRATCHISNCTSGTCTVGQPQTIEIKQRSSCEDFNVSASKVSISQGQSSALTAIGCSGRVQWNKNAGIGDNKIVSPTTTTTYTAICSSTNCQKSVTINVVTAGCEGFQVTVPQPNIPSGMNDSWTQPTVTGCAGTVGWSDAEGNSIELTTYSFRNEIQWSGQSSLTYTATCQATGCQQSFTINAPVSSSFALIASPAEIASGQSSKLTAIGCDGTVTWQEVPLGFLTNGRNVSPTQTTTYSATCLTKGNKTLTSFVTVTVGSTDCSLTISASPNTLNDAYFQETTLTASGCSGTVTWNNGAGSGFKVIVSPSISTTYTATCTKTTGTCTGSTTVIVIPCANFQTQITDNGQIRAKGCPGKVIWENQGREGMDFTPVSAEATTYTAICTVSGCRSSIFYAVSPGYLYCQAFTAKANPSLVYYQTSTAVTFTATGCEAGVVQWSTGQTGTAITQNLSLSAATTYTADCYIDNQKVTSATVTVDIFKTSNGQPITSACKDFRVNITPTNTAVSFSHPPNTEFRVVASGCPGQVNWTTTEAAGGIVTPSETKTYFATCLDNTGSICNSASATAFIEQDPCAIYGGYTQESLSRLDFLTNAIGINGETCPGRVVWYRSESRIESSIICTLSPGQPRYNLPTPQYQTVRYYHDCVVSSGNICRGDVTFYINTKANEARVAATGCLPQPLPASLLPFFQNLVCDSKSEWNRSDYLAAIQTAVTTNAVLSTYAPNFSAVSQSTFVAALQANNCQAAAQELIKAFSGNVSVDDFNDKIKPQYATVLEKVLNSKIYYIMANGKAFELPQGAQPKFFQSTLYPNGVLQGFELADGRQYINRFEPIISGGPNVLRAYSEYQRIANNQYVKNDYIYPNLTIKGMAKAHYLIRYEENGECGWREYIGEYDFKAPNEGNEVIVSENPPNTNVINSGLNPCDNDELIEIEGNRFILRKTSDGIITKVQGTWQAFGKCPTCPAIAEQALQAALNKVTGLITKETVIIEAKKGANAVFYGTTDATSPNFLGSIEYSEMKLLDLLKNLSKTYNSLVDQAKVPEAVWKPQEDLPTEDKNFFVRDNTGVIVGSLDGVAGEATDKAQLVGLGLKVVSDPQEAWNSLVSFKNSLDWSKAGSIAKTMAQGIVGYDAAEFNQGGIYAKHATGKVAGTITFDIVTGGIVLSMVNKVPDLLALLGKVTKKLEDLNWQKADIDAFTWDFQNSEDLLNKFDDGTLDPQAWKALSVHTVLRKDPAILQKATSVIQKGHISQADLETIISVNKGLGARASAVADLLDDLDNFALYRNQSGFGAIISGLKADWYNGAGADGANWVIAALRKEGTGTFPATTTNFEVSKTIGSNTRRYDAIVDNAIMINNLPKNRYFEFKSYSSVPPSNFSDQFINDLNNADITDLSQLRWYFDAAKNPPNFETNIKNAIDGLTIPLTTAQKFGFEDVIDFKTKIKTDFATIFLLK